MHAGIWHGAHVSIFLAVQPAPRPGVYVGDPGLWQMRWKYVSRHACKDTHGCARELGISIPVHIIHVYVAWNCVQYAVYIYSSFYVRIYYKKILVITKFPTTPTIILVKPGCYVIDAGIGWSSFCRRHFDCIFVREYMCILIQYSIKFAHSHHGIRHGHIIL